MSASERRRALSRPVEGRRGRGGRGRGLRRSKGASWRSWEAAKKSALAGLESWRAGGPRAGVLRRAARAGLLEGGTLRAGSGVAPRRWRRALCEERKSCAGSGASCLPAHLGQLGGRSERRGMRCWSGFGAGRLRGVGGWSWLEVRAGSGGWLFLGVACGALRMLVAALLAKRGLFGVGVGISAVDAAWYSAGGDRRDGGDRGAGCAAVSSSIRGRPG